MEFVNSLIATARPIKVIDLSNICQYNKKKLHAPLHYDDMSMADCKH